jgi:hypothetical protein
MLNIQDKIADLITDVRRWSHSGQVKKNHSRLVSLLEELNQLVKPGAVFGLDCWGDIHYIYDVTSGLSTGYNGTYVHTRVDVVWYYHPLSCELRCMRTRHDIGYAGKRYFVPIAAFPVNV